MAMLIFRWVMGVLTFGLGGVALLCLVVYIISGIDLWADRARKLRQLAWTAALFWFNLEIWGRVFWILIYWNG
jgi:hypothetical protein